jgi:hypothetical protein
MAESLGYLLAQSFQLTGSQAMSTTDDRGGPTSRTVAAGWYRTLLANGMGNSHTDPAELLAAVEGALDATKWTVALTSTGRVRFTYLGSSTGSISFSGATTLRNLLGFAGNVGPLATNGTATATHAPTHCVFAAAMDPDSGWVDQAARFAGAQLPNGTVYGWHDGRNNYRRSAAFKLLPKDAAFAASLASDATPAFPAGSRWLAPSTGEPAQAPPWGALDTLATAYGIECGITWGELQQVLAGTVTAYEKVYLTPEMAQAPRVALSIPGYDARRDVAVELSYAGEGTL